MKSQLAVPTLIHERTARDCPENALVYAPRPGRGMLLFNTEAGIYSPCPFQDETRHFGDQ